MASGYIYILHQKPEERILPPHCDTKFSPPGLLVKNVSEHGDTPQQEVIQQQHNHERQTYQGKR